MKRTAAGSTTGLHRQRSSGSRASPLLGIITDRVDFIECRQSERVPRADLIGGQSEGAPAIVKRLRRRCERGSYAIVTFPTAARIGVSG